MQIFAVKRENSLKCARKMALRAFQTVVNSFLPTDKQVQNSFVFIALIALHIQRLCLIYGISQTNPPKFIHSRGPAP